MGQLSGRVLRPQTHKGHAFFGPQKSKITNKAQKQDFSTQYLLKRVFYGQKMDIIGHISQLATFTKLQSPIKFHTLHFSIFPLEILNTASQLILAVNYRLQFFNFDFDVILVQF